jgi:hypothetical protein
MRSKKQSEPAPTFESVWALLQENALAQKENALAQKEIDRAQKENARAQKENARAQKENARAQKENARQMKTLQKETDRQIKELNQQLGGITNSNGEMAEAYFYNAFKRNKTFINEKFDTIQRNKKYINGEHDAEFDIILFNGKSAAIIEVKYNAKPDNISVRKIISRIEAFKLLYPKCKDHSIYLGVAALTFRKGMEERLHRAGIATIRQVGKKMVVYDKEVKVF